jgi:hypothetical protein
MRRFFLTTAVIALPCAVLGIALQAQDTPAGQVARVEAAQAPNRQGLDPYTLPELL